jgi:hypothetical protein
MHLSTDMLGGETMDAQRALDESLGMLLKFVRDTGLHRGYLPLDYPRLLEPLSRWVAAQEITEDNRSFLAARLGAFIVEYLIDARLGDCVIVDDRTWMRVRTWVGVMREFDPHAAAVELLTNRRNLKEFLVSLCQ